MAVNVKSKALAALASIPQCEHCGSAVGVQREPCRTAYADPKENISPFLCRMCAEEYHDMWDEAWADYYSGSGVMSVSKEELKRLRLQKSPAHGQAEDSRLRQATADKLQPVRTR